MLTPHFSSVFLRFFSLLITLILFITCIGGITSCGKEAPNETVLLWAPQDSPLYSSLNSMIEEYNDHLQSSDLLKISIRSFPDEEGMMNALSSGSPDLILCSHYRQDALQQMDLLVDLGPAAHLDISYTSDINTRFTESGHSFFPIGSDVLLLVCSDPGLFPSADSSVSAFFSSARSYSFESGAPFFTADSFSELFYQVILSQKQEFHASLRVDLRNAVFSSVWNEIASLAYDGVLTYASADGSTLVRAGVLPCSVVSSIKAAGIHDMYVAAFPNSDAIHVSDSFGLLSLCHSSRIRSAGAFLQWLFESRRSTALALKSGLIPAVEEPYSGSNDLEELLLSLASKSSGYYPLLSSDYYKNKEDFEEYFRRILVSLY